MSIKSLKFTKLQRESVLKLATSLIKYDGTYELNKLVNNISEFSEYANSADISHFLETLEKFKLND